MDKNSIKNSILGFLWKTVKIFFWLYIIIFIGTGVEMFASLYPDTYFNTIFSDLKFMQGYIFALVLYHTGIFKQELKDKDV